MPRRPLALAVGLVAGATAALPTPASAARVATDASCYLARSAMAVAGQGFTPSAPLTLTVAVGRRERTEAITADPAGTFSTELRAPTLTPSKPMVRRVTVRATDGTISARRRLRVTTFAADTKPTARTVDQVVTWRVTGFPPRARVWAHYVHGGREVRRMSFGRMPKRCGVLRKRIRQLPITSPAAGRWRIQLDTRKRYRAKTRLKIVRTGRVTRG